MVRNDEWYSGDVASEEKNAFFLAFWTSVSDALSSPEEPTPSELDSSSP